MRVRIGALEISVDTMEELDDLVQRYGNVVTGDGTSTNGGSHAQGGKTRQKTERGDTTDGVVLKKLVEAGAQGVPTSMLGEMLGRRGKATRSAARKWAERIGIVSDPAIDPFEDCRVGTQRGIRIKHNLMDIAKAHLSK